MRHSVKLRSILLVYLVSLLTGTLALQADAAPNDSFGRLFSSPAERDKLDVLRQNQQLKVIIPKDNSPSESDDETPSVTLPDPIVLQGYVKRNDGAKSTLWINNQSVQEDSTVDNVQIGKLNSRGFSSKGASTEGVDVKIPVNGKKVRLKAGQMYEPETNEIRELQLVEKVKRLNLKETGVIDSGTVE
ncbi:hypothetical protein GALL_256270 [mine drainage metagenome]|uniref:Uncharacterized protein n=1 Tax=mine drainage metagenome TaxID=410659 RepID=A0A1J5R8R2_9ZZZZ